MFSPARLLQRSATSRRAATSDLGRILNHSRAAVAEAVGSRTISSMLLRDPRLRFAWTWENGWVLTLMMANTQSTTKKMRPDDDELTVWS